jgi:hypothetical protein
MDLRTQQQLVERVTHLERRLVELEVRATTEVRTGRVVVADSHGFERIILTGDVNGASVRVRAYTEDDPETIGVELYASDNEDGGEPEVGMCFIRKGDGVSCWRTE